MEYSQDITHRVGRFHLAPFLWKTSNIRTVLHFVTAQDFWIPSIYIYPSCLSHCAEKQKWWIMVSDDHQSGSTLLIYHCWWDIRIYLMELYYLQVVIQATAKSFPELSSAPPDQRWPHQCELGERPLAIDLWNGRWRALKECLNFKHLPEMDRGKALNMG